MKTTTATHLHQAISPPGRRLVMLAMLLATAPAAMAQSLTPAGAGDKQVFESAAASQVVELVRAEAQGVMVDVFVNVGDLVKKGQLLGHTELDATKLQLNLAKSTLEAKGNVTAAEGQAEAWTVVREETEVAVHKRNAEKTRLAWASAMEKMYQGTYDIQLDAEKTQLIQYMYWKDQYEKRFFRSPVDGVVSEVRVEPGKTVNIATHAFTIRNDNLFSIPVTVPEDIARTAASGDSLPVRPTNINFSTRALVDSVSNSPVKAGDKVLRLLIPTTVFPATIRSKLSGMKFEVLFPLATEDKAASTSRALATHTAATRT